MSVKKPIEKIGALQLPDYTKPLKKAKNINYPAGMQNYAAKIETLEAKGYEYWPDKMYRTVDEYLDNPADFRKDDWPNNYWHDKLRIDEHVTNHLFSILDNLEQKYHNGQSLDAEVAVVYRSSYLSFMFFTLVALKDEFHCTIKYDGREGDLIYFTVSAK